MLLKSIPEGRLFFRHISLALFLALRKNALIFHAICWAILLDSKALLCAIKIAFLFCSVKLNVLTVNTVCNAKRVAYAKMERLAIPLMAPALAPTDGREQTADNDPVETPLLMDHTAHLSARVTGTTRSCKQLLSLSKPKIHAFLKGR